MYAEGFFSAYMNTVKLIYHVTQQNVLDVYHVKLTLLLCITLFSCW